MAGFLYIGGVIVCSLAIGHHVSAAQGWYFLGGGLILAAGLVWIDDVLTGR